MALMDRPEMMDAEQAPPLLPEAANLAPGMVNETEGALPDEGVASMEDDVSAIAQEGDFILPYESVLFYGFEKINDIVRSAVDQLGEGVDLENVDEGAEVPIQISNFEYRIPNRLVAIIGEEELEAMRTKGLEFRDQLESVRNEGFVERPETDIPEGQDMAMAEQMPTPMPEQMPPPMPEQAPMPAMMQGGGYVPTQGVGTTHNPGFNNPLQPPTKSMQNETLDMRGGGLVKKNR